MRHMRKNSEGRAASCRMSGKRDTPNCCGCLLGKRTSGTTNLFMRLLLRSSRMMETCLLRYTEAFLDMAPKGHERKSSFFHVSRDLPIMVSAD